MQFTIKSCFVGLLSFVGVAISQPVFASDGIEQHHLHSFARPVPMEAPAYKFNPTTPEKISAGRKLFFDPRLSLSNKISCATCHIEEYGWTDLMRFSVGHEGAVMQRRTQTLLGVGWSQKFGWDGGIDSLEGFSLAPIVRSKEMNQDLDELVQELNAGADYKQVMVETFGDPAVKISRLSQSLAAFMRTLLPPPTAFDDWVNGNNQAISDDAKAGFMLFTGKAGCANCHIGWRFTDDAMHDIGLPIMTDLGHWEHKPDDIKARFAFKTPTLRGVTKRPPYMHDGSINSLLDVIEHYDTGIHRRPSLSDDLPDISLSDREKLNLVYFLQTL